MPYVDYFQEKNYKMICNPLKS